jgi:iron complex outermembrane recepter protein
MRANSWVLAGFLAVAVPGAALAQAESGLAADTTGALATSASGALETVVVTGTKTKVESSKAPIPLIETPQDIQVVPSALIADQHDLTITDALRNVAGVMSGGYYSDYDYFRMRGFDSSGYIYQDGLLYDGAVTVNAELYGLEQIEVMKGPSSSLYGEGALGGLINLVSKHPQDANFATLTASYGSFGSYEGDFDGNAQLTDSLDGRLVGVIRHAGMFTQHAKGEDRIYIAPSAKWEIDANTELTVLTSFQHDHENAAFPLTYIGAVVPGPTGTRYTIDRYTGEPGQHTDLIMSHRDAVGYEFSHRFSDVFTFKQDLRNVWNGGNWDNVMYTADLDPDGRTLERYPYSAQFQSWVFGVDSRMEATFTTGPIEHTAVAGIDYESYLAHWTQEQIDYGDPASYMPLDLYDPVYGTPLPSYASTSSARVLSRSTGYYIQDHAKWGDFTLTFGGRYDTARTGDSWSGTFSSHTDNKFVPRVGATYEVVPQTVVYASYSESFLPQAGSTVAGDALKPETGQQYEAGVKSTIMDHLDLTASIYQLTRQNVITTDPLHPDFSTQTGEQQSKGVELDADAHIMDGWDAILTYSYVNARVTKDTTIPIGDHPLDIPPQSIGLWTKYVVQDGPLHGFGIGGGVYNYAHEEGDLPNTFKLPHYTLVNGVLSYDFGPAEVQFNVQNITNVRYFTGSYSDTYVQPGAPRNYNIALSWKF